MDKNFARDIEYIRNISRENYMIYNHDIFTKWIARKRIDLSGNVLDIGERNPLTEWLEFVFNASIDSTTGDLDEMLICPKKQYDVVLFKDVIEHLFNPLFCLQNIKKVLKPNGVLVIATPIKPHWITWTGDHYHEFDMCRFVKLVERAGFGIISWDHYHRYHHVNWKSFTGIRPFLYMFNKQNGIFKLIKTKQDGLGNESGKK